MKSAACFRTQSEPANSMGVPSQPWKAGDFQLVALCYSSPPDLWASSRPWFFPGTSVSSSCRSGQHSSEMSARLLVATLLQYPDTCASIPDIAKSILSVKSILFQWCIRRKSAGSLFAQKADVNLQQSKLRTSGAPLYFIHIRRVSHTSCKLQP